MAASSERTRLLELFQLQTDQGPCVECFHTGQPVETIERDSRRDRWFTAEEARDYGFVDRVLTDVSSVTPYRAPSASFRTEAAS